MRITNQLRELFSETSHGLALKLTSLGARAVLLVAVLPHMLAGELAGYMFATTLALLAARALLLGFDLELPLVICGALDKARQFSPGLSLGWLLTTLAGVLFVYRQDTASATLLLTLSLASNQFLGGTVRTLSPESFERLINIPMLIFTALALVFQLETAIGLLVARAFAGLFVQLFVAIQQQVMIRPSADGFTLLINELGISLESGWRKLLSNLSLRGVLRGFILWPKAIQSLSLSDSIAFAVAIGEAIYQLGMVFANRRYAILARQSNIVAADIQQTTKTGILLSALIVVAGLAVIYALDVAGLLPAYASVKVLNQSVLFYALMCLFSLMQVITWTLRAYDWIAIGSQLALFVALGFICATLPQSIWFFAASAGALIITLWLGMLALRTAAKGS